MWQRPLTATLQNEFQLPRGDVVAGPHCLSQQLLEQVPPVLAIEGHPNGKGQQGPPGHRTGWRRPVPYETCRQMGILGPGRCVSWMVGGETVNPGAATTTVLPGGEKAWEEGPMERHDGGSGEPHRQPNAHSRPPDRACTRKALTLDFSSC